MAGIPNRVYERVPGDFGQRGSQRDLHFRRPFQGKRQQQFQAGGARFGLGKGQQLGILVHRRVIGTYRIDRAIQQTGA